MNPAGSLPAMELSLPSTDNGDSGVVGWVTFQAWGWPVTQLCGQIQLSLHCDASAIAIPISLSTEVTRILTERRCAPAVLAHPYSPEHHIVLMGERFGVGLPWPAHVHEVTGVLILPPTMTPRGPITWVRPPLEDSLRLSREIDVFGALRTVVSESVSGGDTEQPGHHQGG